MAEQVEKMPHEEQSVAEGVVLVVGDVPEAEETSKKDNKHENGSLLVPEADELTVTEPFTSEDKVPLPSPPPEAEDATKLSHLLENEKKSLLELKQLLQDALRHHQLGISAPPPPPPKQDKTLPLQEGQQKTTQEAEKDHQPSRQTIANTLLEDDGAKTLEAIEETIISCVPSDQNALECAEAPEEAFIWGVKLLEDERSDVILLKFLRARDFKVKDAFAMLNSTLKWRKEFGIDELVKEEFDGELDRVVFMHGHCKQGHPVCYNVYGEFRNDELYEKMFSDEEKRQRFLRWRIRFMEKSIRELDLRHGRISTIIQVNDLKNSPGPNRWELRQATNQALQLFQDNYPEFVAKQVNMMMMFQFFLFFLP